MLTHLCSMLFFLPSTYTHISPLSHNLLLFISPRPLINSYLYERPRQKSADKRRVFAKYILTPLISSCHLVFQHRFTSFPHNLKRRKIPEDSSQQARGERERKKELKVKKVKKHFAVTLSVFSAYFPLMSPVKSTLGFKLGTLLMNSFAPHVTTMSLGQKGKKASPSWAIG